MWNISWSVHLNVVLIEEHTLLNIIQIMQILSTSFKYDEPSVENVAMGLCLVRHFQPWVHHIWLWYDQLWAASLIGRNAVTWRLSLSNTQKVNINLGTAHICVHTGLQTVIHNTARSSSGNIPTLPPDNHHSLHAVYGRRGRQLRWNRSLAIRSASHCRLLPFCNLTDSVIYVSPEEWEDIWAKIPISISAIWLEERGFWL